ncbi:hypothetical protein GUJ93_ZPchr0011g28322 [Zizania palustris]|uniref:MORF/ORRM1/DAG-like MORF domain-containing protein n=1 Tax=Zizania palustris TaxID=103762 RepID=A0A8J6BRG3_ZIZPA|nr:hypothetical protein GUJ93_ZPchr0011g28322 [Zizania palustris]
MPLALRLRRALAATSTSTSTSLLRTDASASATRFLPLVPFAPPIPRPWLLGGAARFRSTAPTLAREGDYGGAMEEGGKISPDEILFEDCDFNHGLITMEFPDPKPSREEIIETYLQTMAKVIGRTQC